MSGIETRAIVDINKEANRFRSSIVLRWDGKVIDAKSILGLSLTLLGSQSYALEIHGPDEVEAKAAMLAVFRKHHLAIETM
ncbi:HPr family phosphocarrier protein [Paenibacillus antri]|uniref:HPr family phosphocarrier protein n=1 Tax=Paenibacillus antri TaxID=2582848 RepID=A0A5R9G7F8_9BACL|nr:HPr family phosphocarrier protein [Paenibacillus antri]TLS50316.1 HPr family phosphocarrier protein [Paenibacillus antri]